MEDKKKTKWNISIEQRWKIPWLNLFIVEGSAIRRDDANCKALLNRVETLEFELKQVRKSNQIKSKMITGLIHQNLAMKGRLPAPLCPKCGEPKIAGGVQWIDHAECYAGNAKGESQKEKI